MGLVPFVSRNVLKEKHVIVVDHTGRSNYSRFGLSSIGLYLTRKYGDYLVTLTEESYNGYTNKFKKSNCTVKYIPNPLDPNIKRYKYNCTSHKICYLGRLSKEKGPDLLIEAIAVLEKEGKFNDWVLDIYGEGDDKDHLNNLIIQYELEEKVFLKGVSKKVYSVFKDYSFLVVPSRFESFGMVILEAFKSGLPVIAFDAPHGPRKLIKNKTNGYLVERENVPKLANAISNLIENKELRKEFSDNTMVGLDEFEYKSIINEWNQIIGGM